MSIDFLSNSKEDVPFHLIAYDCFCADWDGLHDHLKDTPWNDLFKLETSAAVRKFFEWIQVGIDVYSRHRKHQVNLHSCPWFSAAFAAAIAHRNYLFRLYQQNKSFESKAKSRQASNLK